MSVDVWYRKRPDDGGTNYGLSVWREVSRALRNKPDADDDQNMPAT